MKFGIRGFARGRQPAAVNSGSTESITRLSPSRKSPESKAFRELMDRLTAQQASLVRALALGDEDYLNHSYYRDDQTGKRVAYELEEQDLSRFAAGWSLDPVICIRAMNAAVSRISDEPRRDRYLHAAVELEILMDERNWAGEVDKVFRGIPSYLMNGYTDMGTMPSPTERNGREKIKVDKVHLKDRLADCKRKGIAPPGGMDELLRWYYRTVRNDIQFDELGVEKLSRDFGNESIVLSEYLDKGMGVCRHLSIFFQLYLQEAGISSRVVKGNLRFYVFAGRHAWNLITLEKGVALVDVTHPNVKDPFILMGSSEQEVYEQAKSFSRCYTPTPDEQNHYKIGIVAKNSPAF